ncbi:DUF3267 domain-containing protein [Viridibacillus sp. YIM B01967]|uniref:DUF3267 domain-containing protein n=1 Tax=Viridibacillus soli TaxID=2798301 RepID=A0ABS1HBW1_9BACL|nr:DUF3267 domain-containing protein [Viridibacillus soli]MBK3496806.1 DUF3267 domain-containing protein [Viridibacillus soli]
MIVIEHEEPTIIELDLKKIAWQNIIATFVLMISLIILNGLIHQVFEVKFSLLSIGLFIVYYIVLVVFHEIFHLIGFMVFGKVPFRSLEYGVNLKMGVAYATTSEPICNKAMKKALMLPFWTTGVIPAVLGLYLNSTMLVVLGAWLIAGAVGDFAMYFSLRKYPNTYWVKDDPEFPRLYLYKNKTY